MSLTTLFWELSLTDFGDKHSPKKQRDRLSDRQSPVNNRTAWRLRLCEPNFWKEPRNDLASCKTLGIQASADSSGNQAL